MQETCRLKTQGHPDATAAMAQETPSGGAGDVKAAQ
jgi:hypothetical protein